MAQIRWTVEAKDDLRDIASYIAKGSKKYSRLQIKKIRRKAKQLEGLPNLGRVFPELGNQRIREIIFENYRIVYFIVSEETIDILTVHHTAREMNLED